MSTSVPVPFSPLIPRQISRFIKAFYLASDKSPEEDLGEERSESRESGEGSRSVTGRNSHDEYAGYFVGDDHDGDDEMSSGIGGEDVRNGQAELRGEEGEGKRKKGLTLVMGPTIMKGRRSVVEWRTKAWKEVKARKHVVTGIYIFATSSEGEEPSSDLSTDGPRAETTTTTKAMRRRQMNIMLIGTVEYTFKDENKRSEKVSWAGRMVLVDKDDNGTEEVEEKEQDWKIKFYQVWLTRFG